MDRVRESWVSSVRDCYADLFNHWGLRREAGDDICNADATQNSLRYRYGLELLFEVLNDAKISMPIAHAIHHTTLSLPMHPYYTLNFPHSSPYPHQQINAHA